MMGEMRTPLGELATTHLSRTRAPALVGFWVSEVP
jgi:hypothetical protein